MAFFSHFKSDRRSGLDLIDFPTIIFLEVDYSLFVMSQASRRAWRLIQDRPCKVYYPHYVGLMENQAVELIGRKQQAAALLYGEDTGVGLSALTGGGSGDLLAALATEIGSDTASTDLRALFERHAHEVDATESAWYVAKQDQAEPETTPATPKEKILEGTEDVLAVLVASPLPQPVSASSIHDLLFSRQAQIEDVTPRPAHSSQPKPTHAARPTRPARRKPNLNDAPAEGPSVTSRFIRPLPLPNLIATPQPVQLALF